MDFGIRGRAAAVAASSQGLGFACALELAREGASVGICSRDRARVDEAAGSIRAAVPGATVHAVEADLSRESDCKRFVDATAETFGRLDILVTNSGGPTPGSFDQVSLGDFRRGVDSTLMSAIGLMTAAVPHLRSNGWCIVNILSVYRQATQGVVARVEHDAARHSRLREVGFVRARERQHHGQQRRPRLHAHRTLGRVGRTPFFDTEAQDRGRFRGMGAYDSRGAAGPVGGIGRGGGVLVLSARAS
jgi:NAD(P)-dependent dehydrogenase (short-subunit alcohol dehydrogenase family)